MWGVELAHGACSPQGLVLMDSFVGLEPPDHLRALSRHAGDDRQVGAAPAPIADQVALFFAHQPDGPDGGFKTRLAQWPADKVASLVAVGRSFVTREDRIDWLEEMRRCPHW